MNIKEYISSGIIESYVLGLASEEEVSILSCVRSNNPEVELAIRDAQDVMEQLADAQTMEVPIGIKDVIWNRLNEDSSENLVPLEVPSPMLSDEVDQKPIQNIKTIITPKNQTGLIAASILLALSIGGNLYFYTIKQEQASQIVDIIQLQKDQENSLATLQYKWKLTQDPAYKTISLIGSGDNNDLTAVVFWNQKTAEVFLSLENLPIAPKGKQYQLWAIVDGQPVDAGLFPIDESTLVVNKMTEIPNAQAFAITLEDQGGKVSPTMSELKVIGNI